MVNVGANYLADNKCEFIVWAPFLEKLELVITSPIEKNILMKSVGEGYWRAVVENVAEETLYFYRLSDDRLRPDPASHFQPKGVHKASQVVNHNIFKWEDEKWNGYKIHEMIMYELHVGTFTPEGTFEAIIPRLSGIKDIGVNTISLMPVAQFPGERNWGYDGVHPYAVQNSYGGPNSFKKFVNECHKIGIAVILDVVYNHLGPEGNYLSEFGPYFTNKYKTFWGEAINFDGPHSDDVRNFFIQNALHWFKNYHVDGLRLDAVHAIFDFSARTFLQELAENVEKFSNETEKNHYLIAESDLNDPRIIDRRELGGYGIDAQWCDDLHHCIHTILTNENAGYYMDYGKIDDIVRCYKEGYSLTGQYSKFRKRRHGVSVADRSAKQFIVSSQTHDQIGNRMMGERLSKLVSFEALKLAVAAYILSPFVPILFMGEEYAEESPFLYFVSHNDEKLIESVRKGRKEEFRTFNWKGEPPDPQDEHTFLTSKLDWNKRSLEHHQIMLKYYKFLIDLRKQIPGLENLSKKDLEVIGIEEKKLVILNRWYEDYRVFIFLNFGNFESSLKLSDYNFLAMKLKRVLDSSDKIWNGPGSLTKQIINSNEDIKLNPLSAVVYIKEE